jgi:hypothetical protein
MNPLIHVNIKHDLKKLHWQIYGVATPTNNDFTLWLVKGYIAHEKGHEINWAKATTLTTRKKAWRRNVGKNKNGIMELLDLNATKTSTRFDIKPTLEMKSGSFLKEWGLCPYDILQSKIKRVTNFHVLLWELEKHAYTRISDVVVENKKLEEKLIGFKFTMED